MEKENCLNQVVYPLSKKSEVIQWIILSISIFLIPMIIPQLINAIFGQASWIATNSQYVVGTIVNTVLIIAGLNVKGWKQIAGLITLPSISAIGSGLIFKSAFVYLYRKLYVQKKLNYILTSIVAIITKALIIYLCFRLFTVITIIPNAGKIFTAMNLSMGLNQIITASIAAIIGFGISFAYNKNTK